MTCGSGDERGPDIVEGVSEVVFWVEDLDRCVEFYCRHLGFHVRSLTPGHHAFLRSGASRSAVTLALFVLRPDNASALARDYLARRGGTPRGRLYHVAFRLARGMLEGAAGSLRAHGFAVSDAVEFPSGQRSYFLEDPEGRYLELTDR
jgi:catechol 2,3-dioxygenase-like lactoylglutathione lyase family enzyme